MKSKNSASYFNMQSRLVLGVLLGLAITGISPVVSVAHAASAPQSCGAEWPCMEQALLTCESAHIQVEGLVNGRIEILGEKDGQCELQLQRSGEALFNYEVAKGLESFGEAINAASGCLLEDAFMTKMYGCTGPYFSGAKKGPEIAATPFVEAGCGVQGLEDQPTLLRWPSADTKLWGFKNLQGEWVVPAKFLWVEPFSEGLAFVIDHESPRQGPKNWAIIDAGGDYIKRFVNDPNGGFSELDRGGYYFTHPPYHPFSEGCAVTNNGKEAYINRQGKVWMPSSLLPVFNDFAKKAELASVKLRDFGPFSGGLAAVRMDYQAAGESSSRMGYIGADGGLAIEPAFREAGRFGKSVPMAPVEMPPKAKNGFGTKIYVNNLGEQVFPPSEREGEIFRLSEFREGRAVVRFKVKGRTGKEEIYDGKRFYTYKGRRFDSVSEFTNGKALAKFARSDFEVLLKQGALDALKAEGKLTRDSIYQINESGEITGLFKPVETCKRVDIDGFDGGYRLVTLPEEGKACGKQLLRGKGYSIYENGRLAYIDLTGKVVIQ